MPSMTTTPLRAPSRQRVTLMARVPQALADEAKAYATTNQIDISTLVREGLRWVLRQDWKSVAPAALTPAKTPAPGGTPPDLPARIVRVLEAHPAGIDVAMVTEQVNATKPRSPRASRAQVGQCLRHLSRQARAVRLQHGVYTARQQALAVAPTS